MKLRVRRAKVIGSCHGDTITSEGVELQVVFDVGTKTTIPMTHRDARSLAYALLAVTSSPADECTIVLERVGV